MAPTFNITPTVPATASAPAPRKLFLHNEVQTKDVPWAPFASRRSVVYGSKGMIACSQPLAAEAGLEVLRAGGNAADAAVAVSAALNLTEPGSCGIGGDAFCLFFDGKTKKVTAFNGSGKAPAALSLAKARELGIQGREIPLLNINAATVPGCAAAWVDTVEVLGSGKVTIADVLAPAIRMAEEGVPISEASSHGWRANYAKFLSQSPNGVEMLIKAEDGTTHSPGAGEIFKNPTLAATFRAVAKEGKKGFYEGRVAEAIVERVASVVQSQGGVMTMEDLKAHSTKFIEPISKNYGGADGVTLHECPPNGQGITALIALGIIDELEKSGINLQAEEHNSALYLHAIIESLRLAFADTRAYVADPDVVKVPTEEMLSSSYLKKRADLFNPAASNPIIRKGAPFNSSDTVLFTTADAEGNACSYIQSNYHGFGTFAVPKGCGFTMQNRGCNFTLQEGHPNCLEGNKRPLHTIIPALVTRGDIDGGDLFMVYGVMGGFMQPQGHLQVLLNMVLRGMNAQSALDAPRICIEPSVPENIEEGDIGSVVYIEDGIKPEVVKELAAMGHNVKVLTGHARSQFGRGQVIQKLPGNVWAGGSDPRGDGHAVAQI